MLQITTFTARDLAAFGDFLRHARGATEDRVTTELDPRHGGREAATFEDAAAAGRAWRQQNQ